MRFRIIFSIWPSEATGFDVLAAFVTSDIRPRRTSNLLPPGRKWLPPPQKVSRICTIDYAPGAVFCFHSILHIISDLDK